MMKTDMLKCLAVLLMEQDESITIEEALSTVINSDTYQKILNDKTHLYSQSPLYVFSFLDSELKNGKIQK